jgi:hypothetical protein
MSRGLTGACDSLYIGYGCQSIKEKLCNFRSLAWKAEVFLIFPVHWLEKTQVPVSLRDEKRTAGGD